MKLNYFINEQQVSSAEFESMFVDEAVSDGETKTTGRAVLKEDRELARHTGSIEFMANSGFKYEIRRN